MEMAVVLDKIAYRNDFIIHLRQDKTKGSRLHFFFAGRKGTRYMAQGTSKAQGSKFKFDLKP